MPETTTLRLDQTATANVVWKDALGNPAPAPPGAEVSVSDPSKATVAFDSAAPPFSRVIVTPLAPTASAGIQVIVRAGSLVGVAWVTIVDAGVARSVELHWNPVGP